MSELQWWGYRHISGTITIKRYFGELDIQEASESPFVADYAGPVTAATREEAEVKLKKELGVS